MSADCRFCTFYLDRLWFGIAAERVQEVISSPAITPVPLAPRAVAGLINLRGQIVTVIDLPRRLGIGHRGRTPPAIVVVRSENALVGLLVEQVDEVLEVLENTSEAAPNNLPVESRELVAAVCKLPRRLLHLLDLDKALGDDSREVRTGKGVK